MLHGLSCTHTPCPLHCSAEAVAATLACLGLQHDTVVSVGAVGARQVSAAVKVMPSRAVLFGLRSFQQCNATNPVVPQTISSRSIPVSDLSVLNFYLESFLIPAAID